MVDCGDDDVAVGRRGRAHRRAGRREDHRRRVGRPARHHRLRDRLRPRRPRAPRSTVRRRGSRRTAAGSIARRARPLELVAAEASTCTQCRSVRGADAAWCSAWATRPRALMFIGEGPGAEEDRQGLPVRRAQRPSCSTGSCCEEMGITRDRVYIANVVKCRPPDNRDPKPDEIDACRPYLAAAARPHPPAVVVTPSGASPASGCCRRPKASPSCGAGRTRSPTACSSRRCTRRRRCGAGRSRSPRCGPTSCGPSSPWPRRSVVSA